MATQFKLKRYTQRYRSKWEQMEPFKGWLKPMPSNDLKAYCSLCNVVIKAHLCDLRKHGASVKHMKAVRLVKILKNINNSEKAEEINISEDDIPTSNKWAKVAVASLIRHVKLYWEDIQRGTRRKKDVWGDISTCLASEGHVVSGYECSKKFRNMKLNYFSVLERLLKGETESVRIHYFEPLHELLGGEAETIEYLNRSKDGEKFKSALDNVSEDDGSIQMEEFHFDNPTNDFEWTEEPTNLLLDYLLEFKDFYTENDEESEETIWLTVAEQLCIDGHEVDSNSCRSRWASLLSEFVAQKKTDPSTTLSTSPYYSKVCQVVNTVPIATTLPDSTTNMGVISSPVKKDQNNTSKRSCVELLLGNSEEDDFEASNERSDSTPKSAVETVRQIGSLSDSAELWQRLSMIEERLDDMAEQQESYKHSNVLLSQILGELNTLANNLGSGTSLANTNESLADSGQMKDGIALVVSNAE